MVVHMTPWTILNKSNQFLKELETINFLQFSTGPDLRPKMGYFGKVFFLQFWYDLWIDKLILASEIKFQAHPRCLSLNFRALN